MSAIVGAELQFDRFISADPTNGIIAVLKSDASVANLLAYSLATGDVTWSAPANSSGTNTRRHLFDRPIESTSTITGTSGTFSSTITGPTINLDQGAADGEIITLRSSDVAHGMTGRTDTTTYGFADKASETSGGLRVAGFSEDIVGMNLWANATNSDTTKSAAAVGVFVFQASKKSGASSGSLGANDNLAAFINHSGAATHILDAEGDSHQDVGTAWTNFDSHDDVALLNKLAANVTRRDDPLRSAFGILLLQGREELERHKLLTFNEDGHHFVNMSRLTMLHTGALRQVGAKLDKVIDFLVTNAGAAREAFAIPVGSSIVLA